MSFSPPKKKKRKQTNKTKQKVCEYLLSFNKNEEDDNDFVVGDLFVLIENYI